MDVLAATESIIPNNDNENKEETTKAEPESQVKEDNPFQQAISVWRGVDLTNLVPKLDTTASDIVSHQRDALVQRKELAQKTKDFRRLDDSSKLAEYKGLLKSYQAFIDLLTNQGKASSSAFLQLYSALSEAPDPYPLLEASVDSFVHSETTLPKVTAEKEHLQSSVSSLTSQLEETERKLEEERTARRKLEETQETKIKEVEATWSAVLDEKVNNWEAKEKSLEEKAENHERLMKEIKASYEVSQRLEQEDGNDGTRSAATAAELEIVASDLEKTSSRLAEVEARNEQLRLDLAQAVSHTQTEQKGQSLEDDPAYQRLQSENSSLLRKIDTIRFDKDAERHSWESKIRKIERTTEKLNAERDELRSKLDKWADYDDIRRELEVIKSIEFATGDDEDEPGDTSATAADLANGGSNKSKEETLEQLLLARNKKLTNELTILRVSHQDLQNQLEALREELSKNNAELERSQKLSATLENDLLRLQKESSNAYPPPMSVAGTFASKYHPSRRGRTSPTSSIISGFDQASASPSNLEAIRAGEPVGGGSGILPMVQAQRDRFKQKNSELEEELSNTYNTVKSLRQEVTSLQRDNLNLYEKTRYVSTYNRGQTASSSTASAYNPKPVSSSSVHLSADTPSGLSLDHRYQPAYEAQISPFAAFRGRESARAYRRMSLPERIIFSITRLVLANRTSRNLFAAYCLAIHILLFVVLYMMSTMEIEQHGASALGAAAAGPGGAYSVSDSNTGVQAELHGDDWQQEGFE